MLRLTLQLIPFGDEEQKEIISQVEIWNTGRKNEYEEYTYEYVGWWKDISGETRKIHKDRVVHDRRRMVWYLIYKIIRVILKPFFYIKE